MDAKNKNEQQSTPDSAKSAKQPTSSQLWMGVAAALFLAVCALGYVLYERSGELDQARTDLVQSSDENRERTEMIEPKDTGEAEKVETEGRDGEGFSEQPTAPEVSTDLLLVGHDKSDDSEILLRFAVNNGFESVSLEYGTDPENLNRDAKYNGGGLGYDISGYGQYTLNLGEIEPGEYFYRFVGVKQDNSQHYTGIATFSDK